MADYEVIESDKRREENTASVRYTTASVFS